jgi:radical SAM protein with 4Fe4S-binding SPASM domain
VERPPTLCALPWQNLSLDVDGSSRPCCKFAHQDDASPYQMANLKDAPLDAVWNGEGMQKLRRDFLDGVKPAECATCWDEEDVGILSLRQTWHHRGLRAEPDFDEIAPDHPVALDLKLTNACNLKCRICGPVASSLWLREEQEVSGDDLDPYLAENKRYFLSNKITNQAPNATVFAEWLPHLEHVELTGGEPMMSPENRQVVEALAAGTPERVALLVTTNATVIDERIVGPFEQFGSVTVSLSIDDIDRRLEYERSPCDWPAVEDNIVRYADMASERVQIYLNSSVSTINVWYLPEFLDWITGDPRLATIGVHLNLVHNARHYNVQALPPAVKARVRERVEAELADGRHPEHLRRQVAEVLDFMDDGQEPASVWDDFLEHTANRDRIRSERFADVFAEYHAELVRLGAWIPEQPLEVRPRGPGDGRLVRTLRPVTPPPVRRLARRLLRA